MQSDNFREFFDIFYGQTVIAKSIKDFRPEDNLLIKEFRLKNFLSPNNCQNCGEQVVMNLQVMTLVETVRKQGGKISICCLRCFKNFFFPGGKYCN